MFFQNASKKADDKGAVVPANVIKLKINEYRTYSGYTTLQMDKDYTTYTLFQPADRDEDMGEPIYRISDYIILFIQDKFTWNEGFERWIRNLIDNVVKCNIDQLLNIGKQPDMMSEWVRMLLGNIFSNDPYVLNTFLFSRSSDVGFTSVLDSNNFIRLNLWCLKSYMKGRNINVGHDIVDIALDIYNVTWLTDGQMPRSLLQMVDDRGNDIPMNELKNEIFECYNQLFGGNLEAVNIVNLFNVARTQRGNLKNVENMFDAFKKYMEALHSFQFESNGDGLNPILKKSSEKFAQFGGVTKDNTVPRVEMTRIYAQVLLGELYDLMTKQTNVKVLSKATETSQFYKNGTFPITPYTLADIMDMLDKWHDANVGGDQDREIQIEIDYQRFQSLFNLIQLTTCCPMGIGRMYNSGASDIFTYDIVIFMKLCIVLMSSVDTKGARLIEKLLTGSFFKRWVYQHTTVNIGYFIVTFLAILTAIQHGTINQMSTIYTFKKANRDMLIGCLKYADLFGMFLGASNGNVVYATDYMLFQSNQDFNNIIGNINAHLMFTLNWKDFKSQNPFRKITFYPYPCWINNMVLDETLAKDDTSAKPLREAVEIIVNKKSLGTITDTVNLKIETMPGTKNVGESLIDFYTESSKLETPIFVFKGQEMEHQLYKMKSMLDGLSSDFSSFENIVFNADQSIKSLIKGAFPSTFKLNKDVGIMASEFMTIYKYDTDKNANGKNKHEQRTLVKVANDVKKMGGIMRTIAKGFQIKYNESDGINAFGLRTKMNTRFQMMMMGERDGNGNSPLADYIDEFSRGLLDSNIAPSAVAEEANDKARQLHRFTMLCNIDTMDPNALASTKFKLFWTVLAVSVDYLEILQVKINGLIGNLIKYIMVKLGISTASNKISKNLEAARTLANSIVSWLRAVHVEMIVDEDSRFMSKNPYFDSEYPDEAVYVPRLVSYTKDKLKELARTSNVNAKYYKDLSERDDEVKPYQATSSVESSASSDQLLGLVKYDTKSLNGMANDNEGKANTYTKTIVDNLTKANLSNTLEGADSTIRNIKAMMRIRNNVSDKYQGGFSLDKSTAYVKSSMIDIPLGKILNCILILNDIMKPDQLTSDVRRNLATDKNNALTNTMNTYPISANAEERDMSWMKKFHETYDILIDQWNHLYIGVNWFRYMNKQPTVNPTVYLTTLAGALSVWMAAVYIPMAFPTQAALMFIVMTGDTNYSSDFNAAKSNNASLNQLYMSYIHDKVHVDTMARNGAIITNDVFVIKIKYDFLGGKPLYIAVQKSRKSLSWHVDESRLDRDDIFKGAPFYEMKYDDIYENERDRNVMEIELFDSTTNQTMNVNRQTAGEYVNEWMVQGVQKKLSNNINAQSFRDTMDVDESIHQDDNMEVESSQLVDSEELKKRIKDAMMGIVTSLVPPGDKLDLTQEADKKLKHLADNNEIVKILNMPTPFQTNGNKNATGGEDSNAQTKEDSGVIASCGNYIDLLPASSSLVSNFNVKMLHVKNKIELLKKLTNNAPLVGDGDNSLFGPAGLEFYNAMLKLYDTSRNWINQNGQGTYSAITTILEATKYLTALNSQQLPMTSDAKVKIENIHTALQNNNVKQYLESSIGKLFERKYKEYNERATGAIVGNLNLFTNNRGQGSSNSTNVGNQTTFNQQKSHVKASNVIGALSSSKVEEYTNKLKDAATHSTYQMENPHELDLDSITVDDIIKALDQIEEDGNLLHMCQEAFNTGNIRADNAFNAALNDLNEKYGAMKKFKDKYGQYKESIRVLMNMYNAIVDYKKNKGDADLYNRAINALTQAAPPFFAIYRRLKSDNVKNTVEHTILNPFTQESVNGFLKLDKNVINPILTQNGFNTQPSTGATIDDALTILKNKPSSLSDVIQTISNHVLSHCVKGPLSDDLNREEGSATTVGKSKTIFTLMFLSGSISSKTGSLIPIVTPNSDDMPIYYLDPTTYRNEPVNNHENPDAGSLSPIYNLNHPNAKDATRLIVLEISRHRIGLLINNGKNNGEKTNDMLTSSAEGEKRVTIKKEVTAIELDIEGGKRNTEMTSMRFDAFYHYQLFIINLTYMGSNSTDHPATMILSSFSNKFLLLPIKTTDASLLKVIEQQYDQHSLLNVSDLKIVETRHDSLLIFDGIELTRTSVKDILPGLKATAVRGAEGASNEESLVRLRLDNDASRTKWRQWLSQTVAIRNNKTKSDKGISILKDVYQKLTLSMPDDREPDEMFEICPAWIARTLMIKNNSNEMEVDFDSKTLTRKKNTEKIEFVHSELINREDEYIAKEFDKWVNIENYEWFTENEWEHILMYYLIYKMRFAAKDLQDITNKFSGLLPNEELPANDDTGKNVDKNESIKKNGKHYNMFILSCLFETLKKNGYACKPITTHDNTSKEKVTAGILVSETMEKVIEKGGEWDENNTSKIVSIVHKWANNFLKLQQKFKEIESSKVANASQAASSSNSSKQTNENNQKQTNKNKK